MMRKLALTMVTALALTACGQETEPPKAAPEAPATLAAGTYEVTTTVKSLSSTDGTPVPTFAKVGDTVKSQGCVGADGLPKTDLLGVRGDSCTIENPYVRSGRMSLTLNCTRKGQGQLNGQMDGSFTADGFTGTLTVNSMFAGSGDYALVEEITARKISDQCVSGPVRAGVGEGASS